MTLSSTQDEDESDSSLRHRSNQPTPVHSRPQSSIINAASSEAQEDDREESGHADLITSILDSNLVPSTALPLPTHSIPESASEAPAVGDVGAGSMITDFLDNFSPISTTQLPVLPKRPSSTREDRADASSALSSDSKSSNPGDHVPFVSGHRSRQSRVLQQGRQHSSSTPNPSAADNARSEVASQRPRSFYPRQKSGSDIHAGIAAHRPATPQPGTPLPGTPTPGTPMQRSHAPARTDSVAMDGPLTIGHRRTSTVKSPPQSPNQ